MQYVISIQFKTVMDVACSYLPFSVCGTQGTLHVTIILLLPKGLHYPRALYLYMWACMLSKYSCSLIMVIKTHPVHVYMHSPAHFVCSSCLTPHTLGNKTTPRALSVRSSCLTPHTLGNKTTPLRHFLCAQVA